MQVHSHSELPKLNMFLKFKLRTYLPLFFIIIVFLVLTKKKKTQERHYEIFLANTRPEKVWDYLADYKNIVNMNKRM